MDPISIIGGVGVAVVTGALGGLKELISLPLHLHAQISSTCSCFNNLNIFCPVNSSVHGRTIGDDHIVERLPIPDDVPQQMTLQDHYNRWRQMYGDQSARFVLIYSGTCLPVWTHASHEQFPLTKEKLREIEELASKLSWEQNGEGELGQEIRGVFFKVKELRRKALKNPAEMYSSLDPSYRELFKIHREGRQHELSFEGCMVQGGDPLNLEQLSVIHRSDNLGELFRTALKDQLRRRSVLTEEDLMEMEDGEFVAIKGQVEEAFKLAKVAARQLVSLAEKKNASLQLSGLLATPYAHGECDSGPDSPREKVAVV
ncbi:MAG: hypothetical protein ACQEP8_03195 [Chlamydiota bacterium]